MSDIKTMPRSVSQTEQYEKCGWQFYLKRIERVLSRPAAWSVQGTAFHSAAELRERDRENVTAEEMLSHYSDLYSKLINKSLDEEPDLNRWMTAGPPAGQDIADRYVLGQEQTRKYWEYSQAKKPPIWVTPDGKQALELYFEVQIGSTMVRGYIDQLLEETDGTVKVRDLKTGSTKSKFQLQTYKIAVEKLFGVKVNKGDWYMGKTHGLSRVVDLSEVTEEEVGAQYAAMDAGVKAGRFEPNPGFMCRFCDVSHACSFSTARS